MTFRNRALRRPQSLWLRKALFQIHLWTGIAIGIYVVLISVSGSAIVFRNELYKSLWPGPKIVPISGPRLSHDELKKAVHQAWPHYSITYIWDAKRKDEATEVWLEKDGVAKPKTVGRLFDPFNGRDLGRSRPISIGVLAWFSDLHTNLLAGDTGRKVNGLLAILVVVLGVTGLMIWWPGTGRLRRSLTIDFRANWKRLNWDLHSVVGVWMFAFVFIWGVTGVFLVFPKPFQVVVNHFSHLELYGLTSSLQQPESAQIVRVADQTPPPVPAAPAPAERQQWRRFSALVLLSALRKFRRLGGQSSVGGARIRAAIPFCDRRADVVESRAQPRGARVPPVPGSPQAYLRGIIDGLSPVMPADTQIAKGVLPSQAIEKMAANGQIRSRAPVLADQIQPSSIDLRLGAEAFRVRASFLANGAATITSKLEQYRLHTIDLTRPAVLEKGCVYIVPLQEELALPAHISGKANPKSSTGRLDIFTRLITDEGRQFELVPAGYHGRLYAEVVPRTFSVVVRQGERLSQLRLFQGDYAPSDVLLRQLESEESLVYLPDETRGEANIHNGLRLSVDLAGDDGSGIIGYRAKKHAPLIDLARVQHYDPEEFWDPIRRNDSRTLILDPEDFYILASRERVRIPAQYAAEMVPFDATIGEFRIHYAGFFDPGFGYGSGDINGTRAVLEVRSHEVPFIMEHGQIVASLVFERLLERPRLLYGEGIGSSYQRQGLKLSKHFKPLSF